MRNISPRQQEIIKKEVTENSDQITDNLKKIAFDEWTELSRPADTVKRLKRKGHRTKAEQYMRFNERVSSRTVLEQAAPQIEEDNIPVPKEQINEIVKEGIVGSNDMISSNFLHKGSKVARSVGRITNKNTREALGTGFLISPHLIMTNNHVVPSKAFAAECIIEFDFFSDNSGNPIKANEFELTPEVLFLTSPEDVFDFTIIALQQQNSSTAETKQFGWIELIEETGKAHIGERLNIIHHPLGKPQHISIRKNLLVTHEESAIYLKYMSDTEPGSSGSPVLNDEWELVALHRASEIIEDEQQKQLFFQAMKDVDRNLAYELMNKQVTVNFGVRISTIANHIKTQTNRFSPKEQILLREIFKGVSSTSQTIIGPEIVESMDNYVNHDSAPINININIGNKNHVLPNTLVPINQTPDIIPAEQNLRVQLEIYNNKLNSQKSVFKALTFLEKAREKRYLPPEELITFNRLYVSKKLKLMRARTRRAPLA